MALWCVHLCGILKWVIAFEWNIFRQHWFEISCSNFVFQLIYVIYADQTHENNSRNFCIVFRSSHSQTKKKRSAALNHQGRNHFWFDYRALFKLSLTLGPICVMCFLCHRSAPFSVSAFQPKMSGSKTEWALSSLLFYFLFLSFATASLPSIHTHTHMHTVQTISFSMIYKFMQIPMATILSNKFHLKNFFSRTLWL